jgi:hypothetical protein
MSIDPADYWMTPDEERKLEDKLEDRRVHYLKANEYIVDGDESLNNGKWSKVSYGMIGHQVWTPEVGTFRRFDSYNH